MDENSFGFAHLWASGDFISHAVAYLLAIMSVATWYLILAKTWDWYMMRKASHNVADFWAASSVSEGISKLGTRGDENPYASLVEHASNCHRQCEAAGSQLACHLNPAEQMERALRQQYSMTQADLEKGLTLLATAGATAPFVGLLGTVWGIYHALVAIGISGQAALEKVAGPVGEALIMTAAGLGVALPAVFAYNTFARLNRLVLADLDAFAHDLHSFFTIGRPLVVHHAQVRPLVRANEAKEAS